MVPEDSPRFTEDQQQQAKKPYRKPCMQEYGTLREMTQAAPHNPFHSHDGAGAPFPKNRT